jgi:membrane fusion protein (multidrug efflux system)
LKYLNVSIKNTFMKQRLSLLKSGINLILLSSLFVIILQACASRASEKEGAAAAAAPTATPADGHIVKPSSFSDELEITGSLVANQEVSIVSELPRKVVRVHIKEGNVVSTGTLLFQLDDADLQAQLERLRQQEKLAALNEARLKDLIEHDAAVQQDYDQAITNLKVLEAEIRQLQVTISKTRIRAPFDGRIGIIHAYPGALVSENFVLTNIVDDSRIKVEFAVPEKYAHLVTLDKQQDFTVASDTTLYHATVIAKESQMNQQTRTLLVRAVTPNAHHALVPGQSARLSLSLRTADNALKIPSQALMPSSQGYAVYVAKNKTVQIIPVQIGQRGPYDVQILKGLSAGDTVITSNQLRLTPGAAVDLVTVK